VHEVQLLSVINCY